MTKNNSGKIAPLAVHAHLAFAHRFEQRRLRARRGAVDFVGQQDVREDRAFVKMKLLVALVENGNAENVRRQQVGRELDALELRVNGAGERLGQRGLARAGKILQQHVAAAGERGEQLARRASRRIVIGLAVSVCSTCEKEKYAPRTGRFTRSGCTLAATISCACCNLAHCCSAAALS